MKKYRIIRIEEDVYDEVKRIALPHESYSGTIRRLLKIASLLSKAEGGLREYLEWKEKGGKGNERNADS